MKPVDRPDLLLHPIRGRIMMTLAGRKLTTRQIAALLPDVPPPSLYRHLRLLLDGGALEVAGEEGTGREAQRLYARTEGAGELSRNELETADPEQVMERCSTFLGVVLAQFQASLHVSPRETSRLLHCGAAPLVLPAAQKEAFLADLRALVEQYQEDLRTSGERCVFATVLFPEPPLPVPDRAES
jgi:DNA-binding transcriptional ArsR family regulator